MSRRHVPFLLVVPLLLAIACGGSDEPAAGTAGDSVGDRYIRLFEVRDFGSSLFVYDGELPPSLAKLLNPGLSDDTPQDDIVSIPVPADGELLGSYHVRRRDGTNEIWLSYDVPGIDTEVESTLRELLDETPWQITGGQSNELFGAVSFQSTVSGDLEGFATVQALPGTPTFSVTVERDGANVELELPRGAFVPEIDVRFRELSSGLEVSQVLSDDLLHEGDRVVSVGGTAVSDERELFEALRGLETVGEPRTAVLYRLTIASPAAVSDPVFIVPRERPLPDGFPAEFLVTDDLTVVDVSWNSDTTAEIYQLTMVTERSTTDIADAFRDALSSEGWEITSDDAQGFGTVLGFEDQPNGLVGLANIDEFESDDTLNSVILQVQVAR